MTSPVVIEPCPFRGPSEEFMVPLVMDLDRRGKMA